jgi:hypothetical protein
MHLLTTSQVRSRAACSVVPMVRATWSEQRDTGWPIPTALQYVDRDLTAHPRSPLRLPLEMSKKKRFRRLAQDSH